MESSFQARPEADPHSLGEVLMAVRQLCGNRALGEDDKTWPKIDEDTIQTVSINNSNCES